MACKRSRVRSPSAPLFAEVAELVYALVSKTSGLTAVWVRFPPSALDFRWELKPTRAPMVQARAAGFGGGPANAGPGEKNSLPRHLKFFNSQMT